MERWFIKFIKNLSIAAEKCRIFQQIAIATLRIFFHCPIWATKGFKYSGVWAGFSNYSL
jgi:hypothetical protein